jgi:hypothetical protein
MASAKEIRTALYGTSIGKRNAFGLECWHCADFFCDGDCEQALNAEQKDIERHVKNCTKTDEYCSICQCL